MTSITQAFSDALLHFVWQGLLVAALLRIALYFLDRRSADLRYATCCAALALLSALPVITTWMLYQAEAHTAATGLAGSLATLRIPAAAHPAQPPVIDWLAPLQVWAFPIWSIGVLFFSTRMAWGCLHVATLRRRGETASRHILSIVETLRDRMGISRRTAVLISPLSNSPSVVGWLRPVILLPAATIAGLPPQQLEAILAHELAHIRRHDYLVNLLQMASETLLFYHPAVWWVSARIRSEREFCCDDLAVRTCQDPLGYARALSTLEKLRLTLPVTALGSTGGPLLQRIERILGLSTPEYGPSRLTAVFALGIGLVCFVVNIGRLHGQAPPEEHSVVVTAKGVRIVSQTPIEFPASARAAGSHGNVVVKITTSANGSVTSASLLDPSDVASPAPTQLQQLVLAAVRTWRFADASPADSPAGGAKLVTVSFPVPLFPMNPLRTYLKEGDDLLRAGKTDEALRWYAEGEQKYPDNLLDFLKRETEVYIRLGNHAAVKAKLNEILKVSPTDAEGRGLEASIKLDEGGRNDEVIAELTGVVSEKPDNFVAHFNLGRAYFAKDDLDQATRQFSYALRLRPNYSPALAGRTQIELRKGDYDAALQDTDELLRLKPGEPSGKILRSAALAHLKRYDEARALVQEVLDKDPQNAEALAQRKALNEMQK